MSNLSDFIAGESASSANALVHTNGVTKMSIATNGNSISSTVQLDITGTLTATGNITGFYSSDENIKSKIKPLRNCLDKVSRLRTVTYNKVGIDYTETGLIAQDIAEAVDNLVAKNEDGILVVRQGGLELMALAFGAIKELQARVEDLERGK